MIYLAVFLVVALCFGLVVFRGAPYLPTLSKQVDAALELAEIGRGDILIELGSGDGKVVVTAAKKGINVVGYELNPILVLISRLKTLKYRKNVKIIWGDFWDKDWPEADAIFTFLLPKYMEKLNTKIEAHPHKPVKLVSFAFEIESKKPVKQKAGVYRYDYL